MYKTTGMFHKCFAGLVLVVLLNHSYDSQDMLMRPFSNISISHSLPPDLPVTPSNASSSGAPVYSEVNRITEFSSNSSTGVYSEITNSVVR